MAKRKYEKYVATNIIEENKHKGVLGPTHMWARGKDVWDGAPYCVGMRYHAESYEGLPIPHLHNYDKIFVFLGSNPKDMSEFDAEIHMSMGEEQEKYVITKPTAFYIPKGLIHCPLTWVKVNKPVMFTEICMTPTYSVKDALVPINYNPEK
jgi:hypothetical protein